VAHNPDRRNGRKQDRVHVGQPQHVEARGLQAIAQVASNVPTLVKIDVVLAAPQELVRGHGQQQQPSRLDDASHLAQSAEVVVDVLDDVEGGDQVECVLRKRKAAGA
jgi:hypothetical protein